MSGITRPELQDTGTVECSFHNHMAFFPAVIPPGNLFRAILAALAQKTITYTSASLR
jgi:hypothetical protein